MSGNGDRSLHLTSSMNHGNLNEVIYCWTRFFVRSSSSYFGISLYSHFSKNARFACCPVPGSSPLPFPFLWVWFLFLKKVGKLTLAIHFQLGTVLTLSGEIHCSLCRNVFLVGGEDGFSITYITLNTLRSFHITSKEYVNAIGGLKLSCLNQLWRIFNRGDFDFLSHAISSWRSPFGFCSVLNQSLYFLLLWGFIVPVFTYAINIICAFINSHRTCV